MIERYQRKYIEVVLPGDTFVIVGKEFHVGKADKLLKSSKHILSKIDLKNLKNWFNLVKINKEYALNLSKKDAHIPGIWVSDIEDEFEFLIDGWHRAYNLFHNGEKYMKAYIINDPKEIKQIEIK